MDDNELESIDAVEVFAVRLTERDWQQLSDLALRLRRTREEAWRWLLDQTTVAPPQPIGQPAHQLPLPLDYDSDGRKWG